jgi:hypothetical protein
MGIFMCDDYLLEKRRCGVSTGAGGNYRTLCNYERSFAHALNAQRSCNQYGPLPFSFTETSDHRLHGCPLPGRDLSALHYVHANCQQDNIVHSGVAHEHHLHYGIDTDERPRA